MIKKKRRTEDDFRRELAAKYRKDEMRRHDRKSREKRERAWGSDYWDANKIQSSELLVRVGGNRKERP